MKLLPNRIAALFYPEGARGIQKLTHRRYVGGNWDALGQLQFAFLTAHGMRPDHFLLDVACGCLRLGVRAIPYLEPGHYMGVEKEPELIRAGLEVELPEAIRIAKSPYVLLSSSFEFDKLPAKADFAIAQSLFTHLTPEAVHVCFRKLGGALHDGGRFFATYAQSEGHARNPQSSHDHLVFRYARTEMIEFGSANGFTVNYIGDWGHPSGQVMVEYTRPCERRGRRE